MSDFRITNDPKTAFNRAKFMVAECLEYEALEMHKQAKSEE